MAARKRAWAHLGKCRSARRRPTHTLGSTRMPRLRHADSHASSSVSGTVHSPAGMRGAGRAERAESWRARAPPSECRSATSQRARRPRGPLRRAAGSAWPAMGRAAATPRAPAAARSEKIRAGGRGRAGRRLPVSERRRREPRTPPPDPAPNPTAPPRPSVSCSLRERAERSPMGLGGAKALPWATVDVPPLQRASRSPSRHRPFPSSRVRSPKRQYPLRPAQSSRATRAGPSYGL